jgi:hypothetical protein
MVLFQQRDEGPNLTERCLDFCNVNRGHAVSPSRVVPWAYGCKTVIGQRLKQSGMHWTVNGADAIVALRCREASSTWEAICNTPHTQTRTA